MSKSFKILYTMIGIVGISSILIMMIIDSLPPIVVAFLILIILSGLGVVWTYKDTNKKASEEFDTEAFYKSLEEFKKVIKNNEKSKEA